MSIENEINLGRLGPGTWLKQIDLEQNYGVSRLIVRQALERLAERGHVELLPNRGYRVKPFDLQRFANTLSIRSILEVAAVTSVIGKADEANIAQMLISAEAFAHAVDEGTTIEQERANRAFHQDMLRACPNRDLVELIFDLRDRIPVSIQREKYNAAMLRRSSDEHFEMIELLQVGDTAALGTLVSQHAMGALGNE